MDMALKKKIFKLWKSRLRTKEKIEKFPQIWDSIETGALMLSFWNETLKNISQDQRKDKFIFVVNKIRFEVPLSLALGISPFITEQYLKDPTLKMTFFHERSLF